MPTRTLGLCSRGVADAAVFMLTSAATKFCLPLRIIVRTLYENRLGRTEARTQPARARLDFADLPIEFFATATITGARQGRVKATGLFRDVTLTVVFKPLGTEAISVISMRRASRNERKILGKS